MAHTSLNKTLTVNSLKNSYSTENNRVGVVDIGSNTIRLVVFDAPARLPVPIFNERIVCALGRGLGKTGMLNPYGVELAMQTLGRFTRLANNMRLENFVLVGTSAIREARDGQAFVKEVEKKFGYTIKVLSGVEEARLSAMGVFGGLPHSSGVAGDMGGGSLDLISLEKGAFGKSDTLPLGHIRISEASNSSIKNAKSIIADSFKSLDWLASAPGNSLYAIGGAWRSIARLYIEQTQYPLHVLDSFTINYSDALSFTTLLSSLSPMSLAKMGKIVRRRSNTLPFAALVLNSLIQITRPKEVIFSGYGLREGLFHDKLTEEMKKKDPLICTCEGFANRSGRFSIHGEEIVAWFSPLFKDKTKNFYRILHAAALLSDIGWTEHPDYRAIHSFVRVLRLPFLGVSHQQRVMLALIVFIRYGGKKKQYEVQQVRSLLEKKDQHQASVVGLALRFAHLISGGVSGVLPSVSLKIADEKLVLEVDKADRDLISSSVEKMFYDLSNALGLFGEIK
jgi:exopolyphosphatase/guanosine-5'-triphosphate,3'-diphosphate pyrophosphatase